MAFDLISFLNSELPRLCSEPNFTSLGLGAERHGSWEWSFQKKARGLNRFIFVALTSLPELMFGEPWYAVEFWAGADNSVGFVRAPAGELRAGEAQFAKGLPEQFTNKLRRAVQLADGFTEADLAEAYLVPSRRRS